MRFRLFEAPESEMRGLLDGDRTCSLCGKTGRCFDLGTADSDSLEDPDLRSAVGCLRSGVGCFSCLREGRFEFFHITSAGYLAASGLEHYGPPPEDEEVVIVSSSGKPVDIKSAEPQQHPTIEAASIVELRRTPDFPTWNEVAWPHHCGEFMIFLGPWQPRDFNHRANGNGHDLFIGSIHPEYRILWPEDSSSEWGVCCFVFKCTKCGQLNTCVDYP